MAPIWGWILAYLLGFVLLQAFLYWYLHRRGAGFESVPPARQADESGVSPLTDPWTEPSLSGDTVECPHCGTANERYRQYRYCRECVRELQ